MITIDVTRHGRDSAADEIAAVLDLEIALAALRVLTAGDGILEVAHDAMTRAATAPFDGRNGCVVPEKVLCAARDRLGRALARCGEAVGDRWRAPGPYNGWGEPGLPLRTIPGVTFGDAPAATADDLGNVTVDESGHAVLQRSAQPPPTGLPLTSAQMRELLYPPDPAPPAPDPVNAEGMSASEAPDSATLDAAPEPALHPVYAEFQLHPEDAELVERIVALHRRRIAGDVRAEAHAPLTRELARLAPELVHGGHRWNREFYALLAIVAEDAATTYRELDAKYGVPGVNP